MSDKQFDVIGVGIAAADLLCIVPEEFATDEKTEFKEYIQQGGGLTGTALVAAARLGAKTAFMGRMGEDQNAQFLIEDFEKEGVDTSYAPKAGKTLFAIVLVHEKSGKRTILYTRKGVEPLLPEEISKELLSTGKILHVDGYEMEAQIAAAQMAKELGMTVTLDVEFAPPDMEKLLEHVDYIIGSATFGLELTGEKDYIKAAKKTFEKYPDKIIVITSGPQGSYCISKDEEFHQEAFQIDAVDTTGAGDVFHGAFAYGLAQGWDLKRIVRFSSAVAALNCRALGGRGGIPTLAQTEEFLREHP